MPIDKEHQDWEFINIVTYGHERRDYRIALVDLDDALEQVEEQYYKANEDYDNIQKRGNIKTMMAYWKAKARYADGSTVERYFDYNDKKSESEQQYSIECWLIERHPECVWYSVDIVEDDLVESWLDTTDALKKCKQDEILDALQYFYGEDIVRDIRDVKEYTDEEKLKALRYYFKKHPQLESLKEGIDVKAEIRKIAQAAEKLASDFYAFNPTTRKLKYPNVDAREAAISTFVHDNIEQNGGLRVNLSKKQYLALRDKVEKYLRRNCPKPGSFCIFYGKGGLDDLARDVLNEAKDNKESSRVRELIDIIEAPHGLAKRYGYKLYPDKLDINYGGQFKITKAQYNRLKELGYGGEEMREDEEDYYRKHGFDRVEWGLMDKRDKALIKDWLADHDQATEDCISYYGVTDLDDLSDFEVWSWISDTEHEQLYDDFKRFIKMQNESLKESLNLRDIAERLAQLAYDYDYYGFSDAMEVWETMDDVIDRYEIGLNDPRVIDGWIEWLEDEVIPDEYNDHQADIPIRAKALIRDLKRLKRR